MTGDDFFDTNILVYAYDCHDSTKQKIAQDLIVTGAREERGVISVQVLGEFFTVVTRKIKAPMAVDEARSVILDMEVLKVQEIDLLIVKRALETVKQYEISYWDSLIVAAAERSHCKRILTEDLNDGQTYYGMAVVNPFSGLQ